MKVVYFQNFSFHGKKKNLEVSTIKTPNIALLGPRQTRVHPHLCTQLHQNHFVLFKVTVRHTPSVPPW